MKYTVKFDKHSKPIKCDNLAGLRQKLGEYLGIIADSNGNTYQQYAHGIVKVNK